MSEVWWINGRTLAAVASLLIVQSVTEEEGVRLMDEYEQKARELIEHCRYCGMPDYRPKCKQDHENDVQAVAAALREAQASGETSHYDQLCTLIEQQDAEIARLNEAVAYATKLDNAQEDEIDCLEREIARLNKQADNLKAELETARDEIGKLRLDLGAFHDMEDQRDEARQQA